MRSIDGINQIPAQKRRVPRVLLDGFRAPRPAQKTFESEPIQHVADPQSKSAPPTHSQPTQKDSPKRPHIRITKQKLSIKKFTAISALLLGGVALDLVLALFG